MSSAYLTDSWSSVSGLAAVAYGSPNLYPEVANQIRSQSVINFLDSVPPSEVLGQSLPEEILTQELQKEYERGLDFADYIDSGSLSPGSVSKQIYKKLISSIDQISTYDVGLSDIFEYAVQGTGIDFVRVSKNLESRLPDLPLYTKIASNIAPRKLDKPPSGVQVSLSDSIPLGKDARGVDISVGYLTPSQYYNDVAYPGVGSTFNNLPRTIMSSLEQGYSGYGSLTPLSGPLSDVVTKDDVTDLSSIPQSVSGVGTMDTIRDLTGVGLMTKADQVMYSVDLTELILAKNGYTTYNPLTDSNGDYIDPSLVTNPALKNSDSESGVPYSQRTRSPMFT